MQVWPNLDCSLFDMNSLNEEKKLARLKLIQSFLLSLNLKPEFLEAKPTIFGIVNCEDKGPILIFGLTEAVWILSFQSCQKVGSS